MMPTPSFWSSRAPGSTQQRPLTTEFKHSKLYPPPKKRKRKFVQEESKMKRERSAADWKEFDAQMKRLIAAINQC